MWGRGHVRAVVGYFGLARHNPHYFQEKLPQDPQVLCPCDCVLGPCAVTACAVSVCAMTG